MSYVETSTLKNATIMLLYSERDEVDLNPDYQRMGGIWTLPKKRLLIDSIINDYDIPKLYFHSLALEESKKSGKRYAVIDGRQRLEAIWGFMDGEFTLSSEFDYQRDTSVNLSSLSYQDIAKQFPKIRIKFDSFVLPIVTVITEGDDVDLIEDMFSRLNEAVPLNAAEKRNSIGGNFVKSINYVSNHDFFSQCVKFSNSRYRHREAAARFLLVEDCLLDSRPIMDTKREYLDGLARKYHTEDRARVVELQRMVIGVLDRMSMLFTTKDELLMAQGILVVYYLVVKTAISAGKFDELTRSRFLAFRRLLSENRDKAASDYEGARFELLEFDRLSQQGTNDASSIKERYLTLCNALSIPPAAEIARAVDPFDVTV